MQHAGDRLPLDETDRLLIQHLGRCSFLPASFDKRFARNMTHTAGTPAGLLSTRQRSCLNAMVYRYRRQIPAAIVAKAALRLAEEQTAFRLDAKTSSPITSFRAADKPSLTVVRNPLDDLFSNEALPA